ncbi:MAG: penicillin acylase family protein [Ilumatobacter sp.]|uniref:penicillin acylase family protein n=1 Tax=Ilumatobacter sp. TaxID=1967498 RepID=UPI0026091254|nr:penicillin acylase family protein [Ilumatobacter sp.]MDJ0771572.1 penicillin acylase family protein [Ilumatobacter sp.]
MTSSPDHRRRTRVVVGLLVGAAIVLAACSGDEGDGEAAPTTPTTDEELTDTTPSASAPDPTTPPDDPEPAPTTPTTEPIPVITEDRAFYILPPGNYGGLPTNDDSLDQLPLYDGLTPLRGDVTDADLERFFLPEDFEPVGETVEEPTGRPGTTILYDEFGVAHITGETREDLAFGAGWVTARDRGLLIDLGRGPARAAVADVPGINAFSLVTSGQSFVPSEATEQLVTDQIQVILDTYGEEGEEIIADAQAYADGLTAYWEANDLDREPATVNDVIATTAFIGSIFGAGGGSEARNAEFLSALQNRLGEEQGRLVWEDLLPDDDPEAPTTIDERFEYGALTGGEVTGSVVIDEGSIISLDPRDPAEGSAPQVVGANVLFDAADEPPALTASNWLIVDSEASVNDTTLAVMGPQLGYYYPEIVQQVHLSGPGIEAQGAAVPGLAMYMLIGRTEDYAWSLTSANQDVRDVYAEVLCEPDGSTATRTSGHYEYDGACIPFEEFDAGTLGGVPIRYPTSVHGPVIGTATSNGTPVALTSKRSTFGVDGLNLGALKDMTEGDADTHEAFFESANKFGFTFNWGYANRDGIGYFASGRLPVRAEGLDRRLPTLGTGQYEWQGFLAQDEHPHADGHPTGRLLNWNNKSAPGFMHGDGNQYGSVHRVEGFDQWPDRVDLAGVVGVMNRSATEDVRSSVWPVISDVLAGGEPPSSLAGDVVDLMDEWVDDDAPRLDRDDDGDFDGAGPTLLDELIRPLERALVQPVLGDALDDGLRLRGIDAASLIDKDLRTILGEPVDGPFNVAYCGAGDIDACRDSLWAAIDDVVTGLADELGDDPAAWLAEAERTTFIPELIPDDFRATNRPTFQQVIEFAPAV